MLSIHHLMISILYHKLDIMKYLIEECNADYHYHYKYGNLLLYSIRYSTFEIFKYMLFKGVGYKQDIVYGSSIENY